MKVKIFNWLRSPVGMALGFGLVLGLALFSLFKYRFAKTIESQMSSKVHSNEVVIEIENEVITEGDIEFEIELHRRALGTLTSESGEKLEDQVQKKPEVIHDDLANGLRDFIVSAIIERKTLLAYSRQAPGFLKGGEVLIGDCLDEWKAETSGSETEWMGQVGKEKFKKMLCERSAVTRFFTQTLKYDEKELLVRAKAYFKENPDEFEEPKKVQIRQIVLASEEEARKAQEGLTRSNFAARARELSIAAEGQNGGLLDPFAMGYMSSAFDVAFEMQAGAIFGVVKSPYGFHILMLERIIPKNQLLLNQLKIESWTYSDLKNRKDSTKNS